MVSRSVGSGPDFAGTSARISSPLSKG